MICKRHNSKPFLLLLLVMNVVSVFLSAQEGQIKMEYLPATIEDRKIHPFNSFLKADMDMREFRSLSDGFQDKIQPNIQSNIIMEMQHYNQPQIHIYPLQEQKSISMYGARARYFMPGISSGNSATLGLTLRPLDQWSVEVSGTALRYNDLLGYYDDFIITISSNITLYDNLELRLYGGYSTNGINNTNKNYIAKSPFAANSHYGIGIEYKFSDSFKIESGFKSEYNFWLKRWEQQGYICGKIIF